MPETRLSIKPMDAHPKNKCLNERDLKLSPTSPDFLIELLHLAKCDNILKKQELFEIIMQISSNEKTDIDLKTCYISGKIISGEVKSRFNNLRQLQKFILDRYHKHHEDLEETSFDIIFDNDSKGGQKWSFQIRMKDGQMFIDSGNTFVGYTFDTSFLILKKEEKDNRVHQDYFDAIKKNNGGKGLLKEVKFQLLRQEMDGTYDHYIESALLSHFMKQISSLEVGHSEQIGSFANYCLTFFSEFYNMIKKIKKEGGGKPYFSQEKVIKRTLLNLFCIDDELLERHNIFLEKIYNEINAKSKSNGKTPLLVDRLNIILNIMINIFNYPSKSIIFTEDTDSLAIGEIFINSIIPQFVADSILVFQKREIFEKLWTKTYKKNSSERMNDEEQKQRIKELREQTDSIFEQNLSKINLNPESYRTLARTVLIGYSYMDGEAHISSIVYPSKKKIFNINVPGIFVECIKGDKSAFSKLIEAITIQAVLLNEYLKKPFDHINIIIGGQNSIMEIFSNKAKNLKLKSKRKKERDNRKNGRRKK